MVEMPFGVPECSSRLDELTRVGVADTVCVGDDGGRLHLFDKAADRLPLRRPAA